MRRTWQVHPDAKIYTESYGEVPVVSRDRIVENLLDAAAALDRFGGTLSVVVGRQPTDLPGEAVTTGAIFEWKSGPRAPDEPEARVAMPGSAAPESVTEPEFEPEPLPDAGRVEPDPVPVAVAADDVGDGLVLTEEEDLEGIPMEMR